jgi:lipid-A-disaccharide synthase-like uncharacterized protein
MDFASLSTEEMAWLGIGFLGQSLFFSRWLLQWFSSERREESHIPVSFWYLSLAGSVIVLAYAIHKIDPVFIAGQSVGTVVYVRNLILLYRAKKRALSG